MQIPSNLLWPKKLGKVASGLALAATLAANAHGQEIYSQIVGAIAVDLPAETDVVLTFPFKQSASFRGSVASVSGSEISFDADSLTGADFGESEGNATHYAYVETGALEGRRFDIVSHTTTAINLGSADLTGLLADDQVSIREHWTLSSAFPSGVAFFEETQAGIRTIELIVPQKAVEGGGLAATAIYYFYNDAWRRVGSPLDASWDEQVLEPGSTIVIRNNGTDALRSYFFGEVIDAPLAIPVENSTTAETDNFVGVERPLSLTLDELGLHGTSVFETTTQTDDIKDQLLVYDNAATGKNKSPSASYFYFNGAWRKVGADVATNFGSDEIAATAAIAIRKAPAGVQATSFWVNDWDLPQ